MPSLFDRDAALTKEGGTIKALTLWEPFASLVAYGVKRIETRSWPTSYRGPLAIHAAQREPDAARNAARAALARAGMPCACGCPGERHSHVGCFDCPCLRWTPSWRLGSVIALTSVDDCLPMVAWNDDRLDVSDFLQVEPRALIVFRGRTSEADVTAEREWGDYRPGRHAWLLGQPCVLERPCPERGRQQLWEWAQP